jgi:hypothetical protein
MTQKFDFGGSKRATPLSIINSPLSIASLVAKKPHYLTKF